MSTRSAESGSVSRSLLARIPPSTRDTAYWVFFAAYSSITVLWLVLAAWSVFFPQVFPVAHRMHMDAGLGEHAQDLMLSLITLAMGFFLIWRAPDMPVARWFAVGLVGTAAGFSLTAHHFLDGVAPSAMAPGLAPLPLLHIGFHLIAGGAYAVGLLLFPDGKPPRLSAPVSAALLVLTGLLAGLIIQGHEPAFFIIFCGAAVVVCGPFSQWQKSRHAENRHDRAVSEAFFLAFLYAVGFACVVALFEVSGPWAKDFTKVDASGVNFGWWATLALTALPPLLAVVGVVVFFGIVEYSMFGMSWIEHRPRVAKRLISGAMALYFLSEILLHASADRLGDHVTTAVLFSAAIAVTAGLAMEGPRERLKDDCRRLAFGTPVDPSAVFVEFVDNIGAAMTPEAVTASLGLTLEQYVGAVTIRLNVLLPGGHFAVYDWPDGGFGGGEAITLGRAGAEVGALWLTREAALGPLGGAEQQLVAGVAVQAALLVRALKAGTAAPVSGVAVKLAVPNVSRRRSQKVDQLTRPGVSPAPTDEERGAR